MKSAIAVIIVLCILVAVPVLLFGDLEMLKSFGVNSDSSFWSRAKAPRNVTTVTTDQKVTVYKWRDEHGIMQFTSTPPAEVQQVEEVVLEPNTNIVKAVEVPEEEPDGTAAGPNVMTIGSSGTTDAIQGLLGSTADTKNNMNKQQQEQQKILDQLMGKKR